MKKLVLLCLAPALLFTACNKQGSQVKRFNGAAVNNNYRVQAGNVQFDISSRLGVEYVEIYFAIENESNKSMHFEFKNSYLQVQGEEQQYEIHFIDDSFLRFEPDLDVVNVKGDSSVVMIAETNDLGSATLEGKTVTFHTEVNGKYIFTISNFCEDDR